MDDTAFPKATQTSSKRPRMLVFLVVGLLILGGIVFAASRFLGTSEETPEVLNEQDVVPTAVIEEVEEATPTESEDPTPTTKAGTTGTPTPTTKPNVNSKDSSSGLDRKDLTIEILNGSGTSGVAGKMSTFLKNLGYSVSSTGNADNFDYQGVSVSLKSTESKFLPLLKKDLESEYTVSNSSSNLASGSADAVIIVGK